MRALLAFAALAALGGGAYLLYRRRAAAAAPGSANPETAPLDGWLPPLLYPDVSDPGVFGGVLFQIEDAMSSWRTRAAPYESEIRAAAVRHGMPGDILLRQGYQESRYRPDVINGSTRSSAGAIGMFQFMPATAKDMGINPLDWRQSADGAARYMRQLYNRFGTWELALMAYNWGMGNVQKYLAGTKAPPKETRDYVAQIGADVSLS